MAGVFSTRDEKEFSQTLLWLNIDDDLSIDGKTVLFAALTGSLETTRTSSTLNDPLMRVTECRFVTRVFLLRLVQRLQDLPGGCYALWIRVILVSQHHNAQLLLGNKAI